MTNQVASDSIGHQIGDEVDSAPSSRRNKTTRACIACRNTKTKCLPSEASDSCEACLKRSRPCIMPGPVKTRMRSSEKFHELEKKIATLTSALAARPRSETHSASKQSTTSSGEVTRASISHVSNEPFNKQPAQSAPLTPYQDGVGITSMNRTQDIIDLGFIDIPTAEVLFNHYNMTMRPILPTTGLSIDRDIGQIRKTRPILFLAILAVSSASILPSFEPRLVLELNEQLARHIFILGTQSIDLVQALLLYSFYYIRPSSSQNFSQTQYVSSAVALSYNLSLHKTARKYFGIDNNSKKELSRTWLSCWYAASTNATTLQQPCLVFASAGVESALHTLEGGPQIDPGDQWLIWLIRLQQLLEDVTTIFGPMCHKTLEDSLDDNTPFKLHMARQRLDTWKAASPPHVDQRLKIYAMNFAELVMYHVAIRNYVRQVYHHQEATQTPDGQHDGESSLPSWQLEAIDRCSQASQAILGIYCGLESTLARSLPNMYLIWAIFAGFSLVKLGQFTTDPSPVLCPVTGASLHKSTIDYLDDMVEKVETVSSNGYTPQAKAFALAFRKLKSYYLQRKAMCLDGDGPCQSNLDGQPPQVINVLGESPLENSATPSSNGSEASTRHAETFSQGAGKDSGPNETFSEYLSQPLATASYDFGSGLAFSANAAYDPATYDNMDWNSFVIDDVTMKEIDEFMIDDDSSWMRSFI